MREVYANPDGPQILLPSQVWFQYQSQAIQSGWPQVDEKTIRAYLGQPEVTVLCGRDRYGKKELMNLVPVINRKAPSHPHDMWGIDGSPFELGYKEGNKSKRLYVFVVTDYFSKKVVGLSISESETGEVVMEAMKNACVSHGVLPHQIQSDHSSAIMRCKKELAAIGTFTPAKVGWARSKPVEMIQGLINTQILRWFPNYTGSNITAKKKDSHINREETAKHLPTKAQVTKQIHLAIQLWNSRKNAKGQSPNELEALGSPRRRVLDFEAQIRLFGVPRREPVTYTNEGITLDVDGEKTRYIVHGADFYVQNYGRKFQVKLDPTDTSMVGLFDTEDGRLIEYAFRKELIPMALVDQTEATRKSMFKQTALREAVEARMDTDAEARKKMLDAQLTEKLPLGVAGRFKDQINDAVEIMKGMDLVGVETNHQEHTPEDPTKDPGMYWSSNLNEGQDLED